MLIRASRAALLLCLSISCGASQKPRVTAWVGDVAFVNVTVVPMTRDGAREHQTVLVRGNRIVAVEPTWAVALPPGVTRVDGRGKWLMPGLADMHVHTWDTHEMTMFVAAGVTTVRNMFGSDAHVGWRDKIARGELLGPTMFTAGPIVDGDPPIWPGSTVLTKPEDAEAVVLAHKQAGYDFIKAYSGLKRDVYDALVAAGKRHGVPVAGHVPRDVGLAQALASGQQSIEHLDGWISALVPEGVELPKDGGFWKTLGKTLEKIDEARIPTFVKQTVDAGTWNCPTIIVWDRFARMDDPDKLAAETRWLDLVPRHVLAQWDPKADFRLRTMDASDFEALRQGNAVRRRIIAALVAAGAPLLVGTDQGNPYVVAGASLLDEIELMVGAGVPRPVVIRAATAGAAEYLGEKGEFGVVAPGARADLLLIGVNPLVAPLPLPPDGVMVRGRWMSGAEIGEKLAEVRNSVIPEAPSWDGFPPFAPEGKVVLQASFDIKFNGEVAGKERLALTTIDNKRVFTAQLLSTFPVTTRTSYRIGDDWTTLDVETRGATTSLAARIDGGKLVVTGKDSNGKDVSLSEPMPSGGFLAGPGMTGSIAIAARAQSLAVGDKITAASLELNHYPSPSANRMDYDIERKADIDGQRVYRVVGKGAWSFESELFVDASGGVVKQIWSKPFSIEVHRVP